MRFLRSVGFQFSFASVLLVVSGIPTEFASAQDCAWARQKHAEYKNSCGSIDGCRSLAQAEEFVALSCGTRPNASRDLSPPAVNPPAQVTKPRPPPKTPPPLVNPQEEQCKALANAVGDTNARWQQVADSKARAYQEGMNELRAMRRELESDAKWQASTFMEVTAYLLKTVKITADLIGNLLAFDPFIGGVRSIATKAPRTAEQIKQALDGGKTIYDLTREELEVVYFEVLMGMAAERSAIANGFKTAYDLANGIADLSQTPSDIRQLRSEFSQRLTSINRQIAALQEKMRQSTSYREYESRLKQALQQKCGTGQPPANRLP